MNFMHPVYFVQCINTIQNITKIYNLTEWTVFDLKIAICCILYFNEFEFHFENISKQYTYVLSLWRKHNS